MQGRCVRQTRTCADEKHSTGTAARFVGKLLQYYWYYFTDYPVHPCRRLKRKETTYCSKKKIIACLFRADTCLGGSYEGGKDELIRSTQENNQPHQGPRAPRNLFLWNSLEGSRLMHQHRPIPIP
jgi:hypothetical protein